MNDRHARFNWMTDAPLDYGQVFVDIEAYRPEVNYRIGAMAAPMTVTFEADYDAYRQKSGTNEVYLSHARDLDGEFGCQSVLMRGEGLMIGLAMLHGNADGLSTPEQRAIFADCLPHVLAGVRLQNAIDHQGTELLRGSLDMMRTAAMMVDGAGRVCAWTRPAEDVLSGGLLSIAGGQLQAAHSGFDAMLQRAVGRPSPRSRSLFRTCGCPMPRRRCWSRSIPCPCGHGVSALPRPQSSLSARRYAAICSMARFWRRRWG